MSVRKKLKKLVWCFAYFWVATVFTISISAHAVLSEEELQALQQEADSALSTDPRKLVPEAMKEVYLKFLDPLLTESSHKVLDLGAGDGSTSAVLGQALTTLKKGQLSLADVNDRWIPLSQQIWLPGVPYFVLPQKVADWPDFDADVVTATDVLSYLAASDIHAVLKRVVKEQRKTLITFMFNAPSGNTEQRVLLAKEDSHWTFPVLGSGLGVAYENEVWRLPKAQWSVSTVLKIRLPSRNEVALVRIMEKATRKAYFLAVDDFTHFQVFLHDYPLTLENRRDIAIGVFPALRQQMSRAGGPLDVQLINELPQIYNRIDPQIRKVLPASAGEFVPFSEFTQLAEKGIPFERQSIQQVHLKQIEDIARMAQVRMEKEEGVVRVNVAESTKNGVIFRFGLPGFSDAEQDRGIQGVGYVVHRFYPMD